MNIDTKSFLLPDDQPPKGKDHPVARNCYPEWSLPGSLKSIREDPVASGSQGYGDPIERDAIQNEDRYAVRQVIPNSMMVPGLIRAAGWSQ